MKEEIKKFYRKTKFNFKNQDKSLDPSEWPYLWKKVFYKVYERFKTINLNEPSEDKSEFEKILYSRRTTREFSEEALDFDIFSNLLNASVGISYNKEGIDFARRTYPSAGARYPIEAYIINNNIQS